MGVQPNGFMGVTCCGVGNAGAGVGVWVVSPVWCGCYGCVVPIREFPLIGSCFRCGCVGAVAERYTANSSVKGAGEVRWDAVLVSIGVRGEGDVCVGFGCSHERLGCSQWCRAVSGCCGASAGWGVVWLGWKIHRSPIFRFS